MKTTVLLASTLFVSAMAASAAFACPNLQGNWTCKNSDGSTSTDQIQQSPTHGGVLYHTVSPDGKTEDIYADGTVHQVSESGLSGTETVTCTDPSTLTGVENLANPDQSVKADVKFSLTLQNATTFVTSAQMTVTQSGQPAQTSNSTSTCTRQ